MTKKDRIKYRLKEKQREAYKKFYSSPYKIMGITNSMKIVRQKIRNRKLGIDYINHK